MENKELHPAEAFLRNPENSSSLYVRIEGRRRRLFINRNTGLIGIIALGRRKKGYIFSEWNTIEKVYFPTNRKKTDNTSRLVLKYKKLASLASYSNSWLRRIAEADPSKSLYENGITTGTTIDGRCIRMSTIEKYCGSMSMNLFRQAFKRGESYSTRRFDLQGYDGTLWCEPDGKGDMKAGFSKEFRDCGNGYYYLLINDDNMIGYDID